MKIITLCVLSMILAGCNTTYTWKHPTHGSEKLQQDTKACEHVAAHASEEMFAQQLMEPDIRAEELLAAEQRSFINCMEQKGWEKIRGTKK